MANDPSSQARDATLQHLRTDPRIGVLIVGAGINGAGAFRDLALQGVKCLLIDKDDWGSGTSAAPSRLIHGGLKYLETGEFRLVAESARERNLLLANAPHLVKPLPTVVPIQSWFGGIWPSIRRFFGMKAKLADRGVLIVELGLWLYDWFGRRHRVMPRHASALKARSRKRFPNMNPAIVATSTYYDARVTLAERLCYELVADGCAAHDGALALNHVAATGFSGGRMQLRDEATGEAFAVEPDLVINAAGPWIDKVNHAAGIDRVYIGGTKGSHLVVDSPELVRELDGHMVYFGSSDGRICLAYPFFGHALIGSTDIRADNPDIVACEDDEAVYMLAMMREVFPGIHIANDQIVYRYAGIRPLPAAQTDDPGEISRDHSLAEDVLPGSSVPVLSMIGGKWTTFRAFSEETANVVMARIGHDRRLATTLEPIGGGAGYPSDEAARQAWIGRTSADYAISPERAETLLERYGTAAIRILDAKAKADETMLASLPGYSVSEIAAIARQERVINLADLIFRRTSIAFSGQLTMPALVEIADICARELGWSEALKADQIAATRSLAEKRHGVRFAEAAHAKQSLEDHARS